MPRPQWVPSNSARSAFACWTPRRSEDEVANVMSEANAVTRRLSLAPDVDLLPLLGRNDDHLRTLESELDVQIVARGHEILLTGASGQVAKAERLLAQFAE